MCSLTVMAIFSTGLWSAARTALYPWKEYTLPHGSCSRNIRAVCSSDLQANVKALVNTTGEQCPDLDLEDLVVVVYNDGLRQVLDSHAPSVTRRVRDRPSAPWMRHDDRGDQPNDNGERPA